MYDCACQIQTILLHARLELAFSELEVIGIRDVLHRASQVVDRVKNQVQPASFSPHHDVVAQARVVQKRLRLIYE